MWIKWDSRNSPIQHEHASPVFANQAEQLEIQEQAEQNQICTAPQTHSLDAPAAGPTSGCNQLSVALNSCILFFCFRPHRQPWMETPWHWTSTSEPLIWSANQQTRENIILYVSSSGLNFLLGPRSASTYALKCAEMNWPPLLPATVERGFRGKQAAFRTGLGHLFWWAQYYIFRRKKRCCDYNTTAM